MKEHKQMLLKDLCGRLPYGVKVYASKEDVNFEAIVQGIHSDGTMIVKPNSSHYSEIVDVSEIKPYLLPMSSMTDHQQEEYDALVQNIEDKFKPWKCADLIAWLNKHHFDYNELIGMELAIDATNFKYLLIMKEEFVPFELAKKLKEKGFREKCYSYYHPKHKILIPNCSVHRGCIAEDCMRSYNSYREDEIDSERIDAPTISQVLKWLREEKMCNVNMRLYTKDGWYFTIQDCKGEPLYSQLMDTDELFLSYEAAALAGIEYVLDNLI